LHFLYDQTPERAAQLNALINQALLEKAKDD
jgi:hypothetical protein